MVMMMMMAHDGTALPSGSLHTDHSPAKAKASPDLMTTGIGLLARPTPCQDRAGPLGDCYQDCPGEERTDSSGGVARQGTVMDELLRFRPGRGDNRGGHNGRSQNPVAQRSGPPYTDSSWSGPRRGSRSVEHDNRRQGRQAHTAVQGGLSGARGLGRRRSSASHSRHARMVPRASG